MITDNEYQDLLKWQQDYINKYGLWRATGDQAIPGKTAGTVYTWMFRLHQAMCNPQFADNLAKMFLYRIKQYHPDFKIQLAAVYDKQAAIPTAIAVAAYREGIPLNVLLIREKRRTFGLLNWMEGIDNGLPVVITLDSCNGHNGFRKCYEVLKQQSATLSNYTFCILNKVNRDDTAKLNVDALLPQAMTTLWLFCLDDFGLRLN